MSTPPTKTTISIYLILTLVLTGCLQTPITPITTTKGEIFSQTPTSIPTGVEKTTSIVLKVNTPTPSFCGTVTAAEALHLRDGPNDRAKILGYLKHGQQVTILSTGPWWQVKANHLTGYANGKYLQKGCS